MKILTIKDEYIKLDNALKISDLAQTGGHAKLLIQDGCVKVNHQVEYRRGKKLRDGDIVELDGQKITIKCE